MVGSLEYLKIIFLYDLRWHLYKGVYSGKIFQYLGSKLLILIGSGDKEVLDKVILKSREKIPIKVK